MEDVQITFACVNKCPYHYYFQANYCATCNEACGTCYGLESDRCNDCSVLYKKQYLNGLLTCTKDCPNGSFYMIEQNECIGIILIIMRQVLPYLRWAT